MSTVETPTSPLAVACDQASDSSPSSAASTVLLLQVRSLRKSFTSPAGTRLKVLEDISFAAAAGETIAITGASGSGKSTLLNLLGGLEMPDNGEIQLGDFVIDG